MFKRLLSSVIAWFKPKLGIENSLLSIYPYEERGTWVFDDKRVGLVKEPFVAGIPAMIDHLVRDIAGAEKGFRLIFSAFPFPGFSMWLKKTEEELSGTWYKMVEAPYLEGWVCPALLKYFKVAPANIYVRAEPRNL